jgi:hypothetical protein
MEHRGKARCCARGCRADLHALATPIDAPDFWVRSDLEEGGWVCSASMPIAPQERPGRLSYRCGSCRATHRLVEAVEPTVA